MKSLRLVKSSPGVRNSVNAWRIVAFLAFGIMSGSAYAGENRHESKSVSDIVLAQNVGACTPGEHQCQVRELMLCDCSEGMCAWVPVGESCGYIPPPAPCTTSFEGATHEFPDEVKTCTCDHDTNPSHCRWE